MSTTHAIVAPRFSSLGARVHPPTIARLMTMALDNPSVLSLAAGFTDNATLPLEGMSACVQDLCAETADAEVLQYGSNAGRPQLRRLLAQRLAQQEPTLDVDGLQQQCFITNGSQQALYLAMQVLCDPGDIVLVDRPSYFVFLEMLTGLGIEARSLPIGADGRLDAAELRQVVQDLRAQGRIDRVKAVYFVSYFSNPSGRTLDLDEKVALADVLTAEGLVVPVLEDAAYRELYYAATSPVPSVFTIDAWSAFPKLYLSTLTKPFASGLKVGYAICSDREWLKRMLYVKGHQDFGTANFNQAVLERVLRTGAFDEQLAKIRPRYERKMRVLHAELQAGGLESLGWKWVKPDGGLYLWLEAPGGLDTGMDSRFCHACIEAGVMYVPGELCFGDDVPRHFVRLSFGVLDEAQLKEAGRRFASVAQRLGGE
jgi:2-aminoadipate transaminase